MFTKIVDFFTFMVFSTTTVVNDLPVLEYSSKNYPYGTNYFYHKNLKDINLNSDSDKPVYFLWDVSTFLQRWDLWFTISKDLLYEENGVFELYHIRKKNCGDLSMKANIRVLSLDYDIIKDLSNELRLAYRFPDQILSLGDDTMVSFTFQNLLDYYKEKNDVTSATFLLQFISSFVEYNCHTSVGFQFDPAKNGVTSAAIYLVPKWNNLSGVNLRYLYLHLLNETIYTPYKINFALLSVDLKNRYVKNNMLIYPVVSGSLNFDVIVEASKVEDELYDQKKYLNLFSSGLSSSFSYNTIIIKIPVSVNMAASTSPQGFIGFMNFSMLDATTITGWSAEGNAKGWGMFDTINSQSCVWYDAFCHITSAVGWVMNNIVGFKQLSKLVSLFFTPMTLTLKTYEQYNKWLGGLPLVSPVVVSGAMLLVLFNFYRRFK